MKFTTDRLVDGSSCDGIDMVIKNLDLEPKVYAIMRDFLEYHFIGDHILKRDIELHFIPTKYQLANIFTKPLDEPTLKRLIVELGGIRGDIGINAFRNALRAHYLPHSSMYVSTPSLTIVRPWFATIGYSGEIRAKETLKNSCLPPRWRLLMDYARLIWEDIIHKLSKKTREKVVPNPRFISLLLEYMMLEYDNEELTINPAQVFSVHNWALKPNQTEGPPFTDHMKAICKKPRAKIGLKRKQSSKHTSESKTEAYKSKIGQSKKETQSSSAKNKILSHPLPPTPVVGEMHKEAQQAAGGLTSLGATSEDGAHPQLISGIFYTFVPSRVLTRIGLVNPVRPNGKRAVHTRSYYTRPAVRPKDLKQDVKTSGVKNMTTAGTRAVVNTGKGKMDNDLKKSRWGNPEICLQDHAVVDSGCSSHMTGNKAYLLDYEDYNGGFVAFGSDPKGGKITGKGKIRTANLDFDDVYFVDELKFNLFSVSQMCDKKNSVLFCLLALSFLMKIKLYLELLDRMVKMDDPNITMEEYIMLEEKKSRRRGKVYNWETATYCKIWDNEDVHNLGSVETEFPSIVFNDTLTSEAALSCEPMVSSLYNDEIDFRISFDEIDDEDYMVIFDKTSFSYKIISVNDLKTDSENDNDNVNMPLLPSPEPTVSYFDDLDYFKDFENEFLAIVYNNAQTSKSDLLTEPISNPQHINEFNLKDETSLSECDEEEQNVFNFNDIFPFNVIYPDELKIDTDNDNDKVDIEHS
ncbi:hypothetical protein Tco_0582694 [Tanacetum coccineum]